MATQIRPNRLEVSDRFPMLGFTVRTDGTAKRYEIAIGTAPELFTPDGKAQRSRTNFYSTRAVGPLPIERGEAIYVLPPEILTRFVGQQKLYYGLATYTNGTASGAEVATMPTVGRAYISLVGLTGRSLQRVRILPSRQKTASTYGKPNGSEMDWAGDAMAPGTQPAAPAPTQTAPPNGAPVASAPAHYDDGYGPLPANQPQAEPARPVPATAPPQSQSMSNDIPLDPGIGGQSIGMDSLEIGDIILSTTDHLVSSVIRAGSGSQVSHAMLYVGQGGQVVEAVGNGVRLIPIETAINDSTVAVAFRVPGLGPEQRQQIADSVAGYIGRDYNYVGVVRQGLFQIHQRVCSVLGDGARQTCENWMGRIDLGRGSSTEFFCSQLIIQAFADAGLPITARPPTWNSPQDLAEMFFRDGALTYVGHLKAPPASRSLLDVFGFGMTAAGMSAIGVEPRYRRGRSGVARSQGVLDWASSRVADAIRAAFQAAPKRPFSFPAIRMLGEAESQTVQNALQASIFRDSISGIQSLLSQEYSLAIGVSAGAGAGVGASAGAGVIFTTDGHFGVYGETQVTEGIFEAISANVKVTVVRGGVDAFNGPSVSAGIELGLEIVGSIEVLGDDRGNIQGVSVGVGAGEQVGVFFSQGIGWAVQLFAERTVPARIMRVRAMDAGLQPAQLPAARRLSGWEKTVVRGGLDVVLATAAPPVSVVLPLLIRMVNEQGYSVGLGLGGDAGLLGGAGIGFGVILAPNDDVGVFGSVEIRAGLLAGLSAGARVIVVRGGIETFNETGYTAGITVEAEASVSVVALFNSQRQFHGVSFQLGVGAALSPIQIFTATEQSVSTALTQSLAAEGDDQHGIDGPIPDGATTQSLARFMTVSPEYPQASRFEPADSSNFRAVSGARAINRIVIHITDGGPNINGNISWFKNPAARVSAHYVVGQDGEVVQMVRHNDVAWHARSANGDSIGIEHVANTSGLNPTDAQYCASAALANWLAQQFGIPMDRTHILGHSEADPGTTHTGCPNAVWDWTYYMGMVTSATCYARPVQTQSLAMRLPPPPSRVRTARVMDVAGRMIGTAPVNTVTGGEGNVTWELDQFPEMKMASAGAAAAAQSAETVELVNWPFCPHPDGSRTSAWFKVDWKFSGQAVGAVQISPAGTQAGAQPLRVEARIEDGRSRDASTVSLLVRFTYRFSTAEGMEQRAMIDLTLFSDGTLEQQSRWVAQAAA